LAGVFLSEAVVVAAIASRSDGYGKEVLALLVLVGGAILMVQVARSKVVAGEDDVMIRNPLRTYKVRWADVMRVDAGRNGMVFGLVDGKSIKAIAVARSSWAFGRLRYDEDALAYYRARIGGSSVGSSD
jgi:hypothetical protein